MKFDSGLNINIFAIHQALADEKVVSTEKQATIIQTKNSGLQKQIAVLEQALHEHKHLYHDSQTSLSQGQTEKAKLIERNEVLSQQSKTS